MKNTETLNHSIKQSGIYDCSNMRDFSGTLSYNAPTATEYDWRFEH